MMINEIFKKRQQYLLQQIGKNDIAIIFANKERQRNGETLYPYRQGSDFYYLTGFKEPKAIAVFIPERKEGEYILFSRKKEPQQELWTGVILGQDDAIKEYGANQAFPIEEADSMMPELIKGKEKVYFNIGYDPEFDAHVINWSKYFVNPRGGINPTTDFIDIGKITHEMRIYKDDSEVDIIRKAADISAKAHLKAMQSCCPGLMEYELEAELAGEFKRLGARDFAFESIVASGANTCILHYIENNKQLKEGELVLVDAGCEYEYYCGDITRTYPVNGHFSEEQKIIYQAVLDTNMKVIDQVRPGVTWLELHQLSEKIITEKLTKIGLLENHTFKTFYMHYIGHWIGLDDHDVGKYKINNEWRKLEPNTVFSVEPGIYIAPNTTNVDPKWWNIGVRIEDDVLVTENGCEVLTSGVPKTIAEIEQIMHKT
jgi:Xaa-Pro aminopeptidase